MDVLTFIELIDNNRVLYFLAGLVLGYFLRAYKPEFTRKKTSRYQTKAVNASNKSAIMAELDEPPFDWAVAATAVKTITSSRVGHVSLDSQGNEFRVGQ